MRHTNPVSAAKPATADELDTASAVINLLSAIVGLVEQITTLLGIELDLDKSGTTS